MPFEFSVPTPTGDMNFRVDQGEALLFVGANGGGKTRIAVRIEELLGDRAHRISAHRALTLDPSVSKMSEKAALRGLRTGDTSEAATIGYRSGNRWGRNPATVMLNDYNYVVQALFAEQGNTALQTHKNAWARTRQKPSETKFQKLGKIWARLLPHRELHITGDDILVSKVGSSVNYRANEMSDGERAIFYLIGQTLVAPADCLIIFDEPELHVHRSIMSRLWDELEAARPDCAMVFISHDLEFAASRCGQKYVLKAYDPATGWEIEVVPEDTGFSEELTTLILGSRKPVLFVEGQGSSLDRAIYRACYPKWTIIPRGSCAEVIHAVVTMRANASLTRVTCSGIVDADGYSQTDIEYFRTKGVEVLPVSEIENIFLLKPIAKSIAYSNDYRKNELENKIAEVFAELFAHASNPRNQEGVVARYCRRRIDRLLKNIDLSAEATIQNLANSYSVQTSAIDIQSLAQELQAKIIQAVSDRDSDTLLSCYDNKGGVMAIACKLKDMSKVSFEKWALRVLADNTAPAVLRAIRAELPKLTAA